jgi:hypothetical protein
VRTNRSAASVNARRESSHEKTVPARLDASRAWPSTCGMAPLKTASPRVPHLAKLVSLQGAALIAT